MPLPPLVVAIVVGLLALAIIAALLVIAAVRLLQRHLEPPETASRLELMRRVLEADAAKASSPPDRVRS